MDFLLSNSENFISFLKPNTYSFYTSMKALCIEYKANGFYTYWAVGRAKGRD